MKPASKKVRDEIKDLRQRKFDQMVSAMFPPEMLTPEVRKLIEQTFGKIAREDGALKTIDSLTEDQALAVKEKLGTALPAARLMLKNASKKLPHDPGGRKRKFTDEQRLEVVNEVTSLIAGGHELRAAKSIVGRRRGVSISTIQRVWQKRGTLT